MTEFSSEVREILLASGWHPGRAVEAARWTAPLAAAGLAVHEAVRGFLAEFAGVAVDFSGPGVTCAREPFEIDPLLCAGEEDRFLGWSERLGRSLFPIGELDHGRFLLGMDEQGEVYLVESWIATFGPMPAAMEKLILGYRPEELDV
ncbi:SUKH-3 domain-containing protein [Streptomyces sp. TLI_171]|uniref:SUKH-3 domain-containing protein n=1 Tax=Streptomyces sp. TLI_171 TaxID=1938859 RepID=UPI000C18AC2A|nr:SUKH-3 domain-containing protein [Streptomyces sp. TLI_171]RKE21617.1 SUKH-3 immunity protein of toxin-antitoxin system [Streptomyces sp. TLI_171]